MSFPKLGLTVLGGAAVLVAGACTVETTRNYDSSAEAYPNSPERSDEQRSSHWIYDSRDHDRIFVTAAGQPLYYSRDDLQGRSRCYGECARSWPPYQASANASANGSWSIIDRRDGTRQWAYNDRPLYTWTGDRQPGVVNGHGRNGNWSVLQVSPR